MADFGRRGEAALLVAIVAGETLKAAATAAGLSERTARRRLAEPAFQQQLADARAATTRRVVDRLSSASEQAVVRLVRLMDQAMSEHVQLSAARAILELAADGRQLVDLEARIAALEA